MNKRIIFKNTAGGVSVIIPADNSGLTVKQVADKDVPAGLPYKIIDVTDIPNDRTLRNAWTIDETILTDGVGSTEGVK